MLLIIVLWWCDLGYSYLSGILKCVSNFDFLVIVLFIVVCKLFISFFKELVEIGFLFLFVVIFFCIFVIWGL